ncbi:MAG: helix-turn-helix transcriptional regulator [Lachnospiraceae bacterium]|nr:helix-turn-helix transcriptional regulator [Lachnospiraceae bacterium]
MENNFEKSLRLLGLTIAYQRKLKGLSQIDLAEKANISRTHISNIEAPNGKTSVSLRTLFAIADALDISLYELFKFK